MRVKSSAPPLSVTYCHCSDCRRLTGAPVAAFAAFAEGAVRIAPDPGPAAAVTKGVTRRFCPSCGSPLTAAFDYLPGQVYVPIGLLDQAARLTPEQHCHEAARLPWLHVVDDLPRASASGRDRLNNASADPKRCG